jgi:phosphoribosylaminoimidazole-succinocarboxamide synthase
MIDDTLLRAGLAKTLSATDFPNLGTKYEGKVRDNYTTRTGDRFIVVTDRISAFDRVLGTVPFKGQVLNASPRGGSTRRRTSRENHMKGVPDPNVLECVECTPILVEMVIRAYVTGSTSDEHLDALRARRRGPSADTPPGRPQEEPEARRAPSSRRRRRPRRGSTT